MIVEAVGEVILGGKDAHPNYALLLARLFEDLAIPPESVRIDWDSSRADLAKLHPQAQDLLLTILTVAAILNSRLRRAQRDLLAEAFSLCGRPFVPRLCWTCDGSSSAAKDSAKTAQAVGSLNETEFIDCLTAVQSSTFKCSKSDPNGELPDFENFRSSTCSTVRVGTVQSIHSEAYASNFASESDLRRRITLSPGRETRSKERHTVVRPVTVARRDPYFCAPFVLVGDGK